MRFVWLIEDLWKDRQLSHTQIAEELGLTQPYISMLAGGRREGGIGAEIVRKVKDAFGVNPLYFYDDYKERRSYREYRIGSDVGSHVRALEARLAKLESKTQVH